MAAWRTGSWCAWILVAACVAAPIATPRVLAGERGATPPATALSVASFPNLKSLSRLFGEPGLLSRGGKELQLIEFRTPEPGRAKHRFLVQGGLHGNEAQAPVFVLWLARRYARGEGPLASLPRDQIAIDFLPYANPDGSQDDSRYNARGVNLNRNFGVLWGMTRENPGDASFSEPETRAIRRLMKDRNYTAAVDVHGYVNWIVSPSTPAAVAARGHRPTLKQKQAYAQWTRSLQHEMQLLPGYQLKNGANLGDGGAFEDWAFWSQGTLAYCLELETFQRFVPNYRAEFADLTRPGPPVDLFKRYEMFVFRMFDRAMKIKDQSGLADSLAAE